MNEQARDALVKHALLGTKKADGIRQNGEGYCALGVIGLELFENPNFFDYEAAGLSEDRLVACPMPGCEWKGCEPELVCHLSNLYGGRTSPGHDLDFLTIARKFGEAQEAQP